MNFKKIKIKILFFCIKFTVSSGKTDSCLHFDPKPNHFVRKNLFFPRDASGFALAGVADGPWGSDELGFSTREK